MSARAGQRRCARCMRATPRKRTVPTAVGDVCLRCFDRLPVRLRRRKEEDDR
jgi:hypothetical protein